MKRLLEVVKKDAGELRIIRDKEKIKSLFPDTLGQLYRGRKTDIQIHSDGEFSALLNYMLRLGLGLDCPASEAFSIIAQSVDDKPVGLLADTAEQVGTHTNKTLDMRIPHRQMSAWPTAKPSRIGSGDAEHGRPLYGCGQSAQSLARLFWCRDFLDARSGRPHQSALIFHLINPGFEENLAFLTDNQREMIAGAAGKHGEECLPDDPGPKQVFLPLMNQDGDIEDYLLISPVLPLSLVEEFTYAVHSFRERHRMSGNEGQFRLRTPKSFVHVGGTKPQNIGDIFSAIGGRIRGLQANLPKTGRTKTLQARVQEGFDLFCLHPKANSEAQWIDRPLNHSNQFESYTRAFQAFLLEAFRLIRVYRRQRSEATLGHKGEGAWPLPSGGKGLSALSHALLTQKSLSADDVDRFTAMLLNHIQKHAMPGTPMSETHLKIMKPEVQKTLRLWANLTECGHE